MELISWSLNAIDKIVSSKSSTGMGEPSCPDGSFASGYVIDFWGSWKGVMCLAPLSVEDVEDVFIFGFMMTGLLIIGLLAGLSFWKIRRTADKFDVQLLLAHANVRTKADGDRDDELKRKMDNLLGVTIDLSRKMDAIRVRLPMSEV